jgi:sporulation protein YtfJ
MQGIEDIIRTTLEEMKQMIDVNTIVGEAVETMDGNVIIPISSLSFGFVSGGSEYEIKGKENEGSKPFAGGSGAGTCLKPVAFLMVGADKVKVLPVQYNSIYDRLIELVPQVFEEIRPLIDMLLGRKKDKMQDVAAEVPLQ